MKIKKKKNEIKVTFLSLKWKHIIKKNFKLIEPGVIWSNLIQLNQHQKHNYNEPLKQSQNVQNILPVCNHLHQKLELSFPGLQVSLQRYKIISILTYLMLSLLREKTHQRNTTPMRPKSNHIRDLHHFQLKTLRLWVYSLHPYMVLLFHFY